MAGGQFRIGIGHDTHRLEAGRPLIVGGVSIEHDRGPIAHSDGDVLLHALTDALLGAAGLGDIGEWFPDTDPAWNRADSAEFVTRAKIALTEKNWTITNVDCIVFAERPKFAPYKEPIRRRLAGLLSIDPQGVNVKAKTGETVGPIGREEAIAAQVVVLLTEMPAET